MTGLTLPFVAVIVRYQLHGTEFQVSLLTMAPVIGFVTALLWTNMMQGRRKMPYAVWPWIIARSLFILAIFATSSWTFTIIVLLFYLILSIASPAYSDLMKEVYPDGDRGKIMGYARVCTIGSLLVVTLGAGKLLEHVSYRYVFPVAAVFGVVSALVFSRIRAKEATGERGTPLHAFLVDSLRLLWQDKGYLWFCSGIFIFGFGNYMATPACQLYEIDVLNAHYWRQSIYSFVVFAVSAVSYFYWGSHLDRRRPEKVMAWQILAWAVMILGYLVATKWWMLMPSKVLLGVLNAGVDLTYWAGVMFFAPRDRVTQYYAVFLTLNGLRGITAPLLGGVMLECHMISVRGMFVLAAGIILIGMIVQIIGYRKYPKAGACTDEQGDCVT